MASSGNGGIIGPVNDPAKSDLVTVHTSSTPGFAVGAGTSEVNCLVVAGGGNANSGQGGCGGAGGYRNFTSIPVTGGNPYPIVVGGSMSTSSGFSYSCTAGGLGVAPRGATPGGAGGSGGGAADHHPGGGGSGGSGNAGGYTPPEGNPGTGASPGSNSGETPGAGGGAAGAGVMGGAPNYQAQGGAGQPNTISGADLWYATGGCHPAPSYSSAPLSYPARGQPGLANTGNGAQGEGPFAGGSGVVVVGEVGAGGVVASGVWSLQTQYKARIEGNW